MEIEIIKVQSQNSPDTTKQFGIILNKSLSIIKMAHWYPKNYDTHIIIGDLYEDLSDLFDKLQEEIIGTVKEYNSNFPMFLSYSDTLEKLNYNLQDEQQECNQIHYYYDTVNLVKEILTSLEFNNFITTIKSGINNTKEEIISRINKANYLLSLIN